jgi:hypothetical protein
MAQFVDFRPMESAICAFHVCAQFFDTAVFFFFFFSRLVRFVATGGDDSTTKLWVTAALEGDVRQERASTEGHTAPVTALSIHPLVSHLTIENMNSFPHYYL